MKDLIELFFQTRFIDNTPGTCKVYIDFDINNDNVYVGFAGARDWNRPMDHKKDLLWKIRNQEGTRRCFSAEGLSEKNARVLEAFLILYGCKTYGLSDYGKNEYKKHVLINKKRERKWEKLILETLIVDKSFNINFIYESQKKKR